MFIGFFLITITLSFLILIFSFNTIKDHYITTLTKSLENIGTSLSLKITPLIETKKTTELDIIVKKTGKEINKRITVITIDGKVIADSEKNPSTMENHINRPEVIQILEGEKIGKSIRFSKTIEKEMLYVAIPIEKNKTILGILRVSMLVEDINNLLSNIRRKILNITFTIMILSSIVIFIFSKKLSNPIKELVNAYQKVASGNFDVKVILKNKDELKDLADGFNHMTERIKTLFMDLSIKKEELNSIIASIQEGLIVLNKKGKIIISNDSFKKLFNIDNLESKYYWEVLREQKLNQIIKDAIEKKKNAVNEIELNDKNFICSITFIPSREESVLILYDISEIKKLEQIKKDFITNVSHELRTPLSAIKGFVETLEDEIENRHKHYIEIIKRHTDRLINIVQDLLTLSKLEEKNINLEIEEVDLKKITEDIIKIFEQKLKEKNLKLVLNIKEKNPLIKADPFQIEQMFINLIDNAIKYTEKGEIKINISQTERDIKIEIQDTGIGIPKEHLPRIFERFYVVDKSHSRKTGGTGLGLSIVKHIVLLHNGKIDVESTPNIGTKFTILLPINPA